VTRAVFFDVDFTLIHPGPTFQGAGYQHFCARYDVDVDPLAFEHAVASASSLLDAQGGIYDPEVFITYTRRIIEGMGGSGRGVEAAARDIYAEWAACHHFSLYEEVADVLRDLHRAGLLLGLISNTQRCLASFERHFELEGLFTVALSSFEHGYMKPHRSIFEAALTATGSRPEEAVMVGDSYAHDIEGALNTGMRAVLVCRSGRPQLAPDVPIIASLRELPALL
jgi:HAD superfamily hydrolase (TIGR01549 family)